MIQSLMPMGGSGKPFQEYGRGFPKSLVEVLGHPLVEYAVASTTPKEQHRFIFVTSPEDSLRFHLNDVLRLLSPQCEIVSIPGPTGGALCTALLAIDKIDPAQPLLVANADQYMHGGIDAALADFRARDLDVGIFTFHAIHPRWSFARVGSDGLVSETAEKRPISNDATCGLYYYRTASLFLESALGALMKNYLHDKQFYICPSINDLILKGRRVGVHHVGLDRFSPLGTPEDVERFKLRNSRSPLD